MKEEMINNNTGNEQTEVCETNGEGFALDIKYNGELITLDKERATQLAQKGMNYDHVYEELLKLRQSNGEPMLTELSRRAGMQPRELLQALLEEKTTPDNTENDRADDRRLISEMRKFYDKHPDAQRFSKLPEEVKRQVIKGEAIESAYLNYENKLLRQRLNELEGRAKTPGSLYTNFGGMEDAFAGMLLAKL